MRTLELAKHLLDGVDDLQRQVVVRVLRRNELGNITHEAIIPNIWITWDVTPTEHGQTGVTVNETDIVWHPVVQKYEMPLDNVNKTITK